MSLGLNAADFLVIVAYLAAVTLFGLRFRRKQTSLKGYFLADRTISWWPISLSIVAAEDQHSHHHQRAGVRVRERLPLSATHLRLHHRAE